MKTDVGRQYAALRLQLAPGTPFTLLHIGEQQTAVASGAGRGPDQMLLLDIGSRRTAARFFLHNPPTPGEMENAIMQVEDEVSRAREMIAAYPVLATADACIRDIAHLAGVGIAAEMHLPVEAVEQVFSLLAGRAAGRPAAGSCIPDDSGFAATLLILREFMHHLRFPAISVIVRSGNEQSRLKPK